MAKNTDDPEMTVGEAAELVEFWVVYLRGAGKSDSTLVTYRRGIEQYLEFCRAHGHEPLRRRVLSAWMAHLRDEQGMQGYTARSRLTAVRQFTKWLLEDGEIDHNPFVDMPQPAVDEKLVEPLTDEQIQAMLAACTTPKGAGRERQFIDVRDAAMIHLLAETGMRAGELLALTIDDVRWKEDPPGLVVTKTKTRTGRPVPISPQAAARLSKYVRARSRLKDAGSDTFWLSSRGGPLQYAGLYDALSKRAEAAGVAGFHPHRMRHTAAHRWLAKGGSESGLMSVAGWRSPQMLMRYTKAQASARAAEEAKRLNLGEL